MILDNLFDRSEMGSDKTSPILNGICTINAEPNNNKEASSDGNPQEGTTDLIKGNIYDDDLSDEKKKITLGHTADNKVEGFDDEDSRRGAVLKKIYKKKK